MANESAKAAFSRKLYALMVRKGMRQADLARASGLAWLRLNTMVSLSTAVEIARLVENDRAARLKAANGE